MAPSPRKSAPAAFTTTWDSTNTSTFDPASLPVPRLPRPWERKPETVRRGGVQKKVWRTYATRLSTANTPQDEEQDSRARAVKRQQRIKPSDMEHIPAKPHGRKRAFKGTRYDRRKSVLPRKRNCTRASADDHLDGLGGGGQPSLNADDPTLEDDDSEAESETLEAQEQLLPPQTMAEPSRRRSARLSTFSSRTDDVDTKGSHVHTTDTFKTGTEQRLPTPELQSKITLEEDNNCAHKPESGEGPIPEASFRQETFSTAGTNETGGDPMEEDRPEDGQLESVESTALGVVEAQRVSSSEDTSKGSSAEVQVQVVIEQVHPQDHNGEAPSSMEDEDEDMSDFSIELGDFAQEETARDIEPGDEEGSKEEFTEASLQLEIQRAITPSEATLRVDLSTGGAQDTNDDHEVEAVSHLSLEDVEDYVMESIEVPYPSVEDKLASEGGEDAETPVANTADNPMLDIADGLTLTPSVPVAARQEQQASKSPSVPANGSGPDEATTTMYLDDDTALLKDFLTRAAASKANKATTIARRTSLQNRRDSDAVRQALASPRKILEDKDPNSPSKYDNDATLDLSQTLTLDATLDLSQTLTINTDSQLSVSPTESKAETDPEDAEAEDGKLPSKHSRRSTRTRKSRLPAPPSTAQMPKNISVRRADGAEPIVLKKTEAQEMNLLTRANTRKNKQGAVCVALRLMKLGIESAADVSAHSAAGAKEGKKNVRWDETLAYYQENMDALKDALAEAESLATPDELDTSIPISTPSLKKKAKESIDKKGDASASRVRRVRGLGAANGTPGKGLLTPASLLPEGVVNEEKEVAAEKEKEKNKTPRLSQASKLKKMVIAPVVPTEPALQMKIPSKSKLLDPSSLDDPTKTSNNATTKERKSRLATPRKVKLPVLVAPTPAASGSLIDGKENQQSRATIAGATPKKGLRPPEVVVPPTVAAESGLPRRRPVRKL